jgi:DNA-binding NtrC family response regulator
VVPPLRHRKEDVIRLADAFLARDNSGVRLSPSAAEALLLHDWPYNVRELEQLLAVAAVRARDGGIVRAEHLPAPIGNRVLARLGPRGHAPAPLAARIDRDATPSKDDLSLVLAHHRGNVALVAEFFNKDRRQIYRWIEKHGLDPDKFREGPSDDGSGGGASSSSNRIPTGGGNTPR